MKLMKLIQFYGSRKLKEEIKKDELKLIGRLQKIIQFTDYDEFHTGFSFGAIFLIMMTLLQV